MHSQMLLSDILWETRKAILVVSQWLINESQLHKLVVDLYFLLTTNTLL